MPKGNGRNISLWVRWDQETTISDAHKLMADLGMSFSAMVAAALDEYVTRHQLVPVDVPARRALLGTQEQNEVKRRRVNGL